MERLPLPLPPILTFQSPAGHLIWEKDLTNNQRMQWVKLHQAAVTSKQAPAYVKNARDPVYSFAAAYGHYITSPEDMKKNFSEHYNYFKNLGL